MAACFHDITTSIPPFCLDRQGQWLEKAIRCIASGRVVVFGDFCLDAYWHVSDDDNETSVETGLPVRRVATQHYGLGGAGNVATNLCSLGLSEVQAVGLVGEDLFGEKVLSILNRLGIETEGILRGPEGWQTPVYAKPILGGEELNRLDFGSTNTFPQERAQVLLDALDKAAKQADAVVFNQQLPGSIISPAMIPALNKLIARHPKLSSSSIRVIMPGCSRARSLKSTLTKPRISPAMIGRWSGRSHRKRFVLAP